MNMDKIYTLVTLSSLYIMSRYGLAMFFFGISILSEKMQKKTAQASGLFRYCNYFKLSRNKESELE